MADGVIYDVSLEYVDKKTGKVNEELIVRTFYTIEEATRELNEVDILNVFNEGRDVKDSEIKEIYIIKKEYDGNDWVFKERNSIKMGLGDVLHEINIVYWLSLNSRVEVFNQKEMYDLIKDECFSIEEEENIIEDMGGISTLYSFLVDENRWFNNEERVIHYISNNLDKENIDQFYSIELIKIYKDENLKSFLAREVETKEEGINYLKLKNIIRH